MTRRFTVDASKKIKAAEDIKEDPRQEEFDTLQDKVAEDFDYVMSGIERLGREGQLDNAIDLLNTLSDTLDSAVGIIGNDFKNSDSEGV